MSDERNANLSQPTLDQVNSTEIVDMETGKLNPAIATFKVLESTSTDRVITALQNKKTLEIAATDEDVSKRMETNAKVLIDNQLSETENKAAAKNEKSFWERNKSAVKMYGYSEENPRPNWQTALMKTGSNVWFVIYYIIATLTVCPLSVFFDVFKAIFKKGWVAMVVAILLYLLLTFGPPLVILLKKRLAGL